MVRWSFREAWARAERVRRAVNPVQVIEPDLRRHVVELPVDGVERARVRASLFADADMRLSLALTYGTDPDTLETLKAGSRLIADLAHKRLSILGLKSGEALSLEPSDRLRECLDRWESLKGGASRALPASASDDGDQAEG